MRPLLLLLAVIAPLSAQQEIAIPDSFRVQNGAVAAIRERIKTNHLSEADTNGDGEVSNDEAIAWNSAKRQETTNTLARRAIDAAEAAYRADQTLTTLPATYRAKLNTLFAAEAAVQAERDRLVSGP